MFLNKINIKKYHFKNNYLHLKAGYLNDKRPTKSLKLSHFDNPSKSLKCGGQI